MSDLYSIEYSASTEADDRTKTCTVEWTIPNFNELMKRNIGLNRVICTNKADFKDNADEDTKVLFKMEFFGHSCNLIRIYYVALNPMCVKYNLTTYLGYVCGSKEYSMVQEIKWQFLVQLLEENISNYVKENKFYLNFKFTINKEIKVESIVEPKNELNLDLENMLNNSIYSDVTIKSAEGVELQAHKGVLATRSAVLKAHFEHNTVESQTNVIETSLEAEVLKELLQYIYTDNTPKVDEMPEKLLVAADYFQLNRLKQLCEEALFHKLTVDNAIATLLIADLYTATNLKKIILDFIRNGRAKLVMRTTGWIDLQPRALTKTILEHLVNGLEDYNSFETDPAVLSNNHKEGGISDLYSIEYSVATSADDRTKTCTVELSIPNFFKVMKLKIGHKSVICTNKSDYKDHADEDIKFLFKIVFFGTNADLTQMYYSAPTPMCVKYIRSTYSSSASKSREYLMVKANKWQFMTDLLKENLSEYVSGGKFYFSIKFTINKEIKVKPDFKPKVELNHDLENMLNNSIYSDITIKSAEGVEFQTHKAVLAARSAVLKAHFEHSSVESQTNVMDTLFEAEVLKELLQYIYTDNTPKVDEMPDKLLEAADYYQLSRLKQLCEEALFQKLTVDNAITTLQIADLYSATNLKKIILDFICNGRAKLVIKTKGWIDLQPGHLTQTILEHIVYGVDD